jgi:hypothetical protein
MADKEIVDLLTEFAISNDSTPKTTTRHSSTNARQSDFKAGLDGWPHSYGRDAGSNVSGLFSDESLITTRLLDFASIFPL